MNARQFFDKVSEMRKAQKEYFAHRTQDNLRNAKRIEGEIDWEILRVNARFRETGK